MLSDEPEMQLWGFAYENNISSLHDDYYASEAQGIYLLVINNVLYTWIPGRKELPLYNTACPDYSHWSTILYDYTVKGHKNEKDEPWGHILPSVCMGIPLPCLKAKLWTRSRIYFYGRKQNSGQNICYFSK